MTRFEELLEAVNNTIKHERTILIPRSINYNYTLNTLYQIKGLINELEDYKNSIGKDDIR